MFMVVLLLLLLVMMTMMMSIIMRAFSGCQAAQVFGYMKEFHVRGDKDGMSLGVF